MITLRRSEERGHADHGWLDTYHTFSFADYHDPDFMGFSHLRVINQDVVQPGQGFGTHGHANMEIVTWVLRGRLQHRDSMGNGSIIGPGDVQIMSAGTGVTHSEFNASETQDLELLQMWVLPARSGGRPRYEERNFPVEERTNVLRLVASPDPAADAVTIGQDTRLYVGTIEPGARVAMPLDTERRAWLHVGSGRVTVNGEELGPGDGAAIQRESRLELVGVEKAEVVLFDLA